MGTSTDQILARYMAEIEERQQFIDAQVEAAEAEKRDLSDEQLELVTRARDRISRVNEMMRPLEESRRIQGDATERIASLAKFMAGDNGKQPTEFKYRSAGAYALDFWRARIGNDEALHRLELYTRAAAHQTTADNPGLLPEQLLGPIVRFVDAQRPLVDLLGARQLPSGSWSRPKVTQNTTVGVQSAEKAELVSQKMTIAKLPVTAKTIGGYVNVSRQDIDWTQPQIMDIIIDDLALQYAIASENDAVDGIVTGATVGPTLPTGALTAAQVTTAFWTAAGAVYAAMKGAGQLVAVTSPQMLGQLGPVFSPVNPQNAQSMGFWAGQFGQGAAGAIAGIPVFVTAAMADNTILVLSTAAAEVYEDRIGALQVVEPSVLGVQVAYAGYFAWLIIQATGIQKIVKTP
jgi:HK97 family phage major capsid protein